MIMHIRIYNERNNDTVRGDFFQAGDSVEEILDRICSNSNRYWKKGSVSRPVYHLYHKNIMFGTVTLIQPCGNSIIKDAIEEFVDQFPEYK